MQAYEQLNDLAKRTFHELNTNAIDSVNQITDHPNSKLYPGDIEAAISKINIVASEAFSEIANVIQQGYDKIDRNTNEALYRIRKSS